jgi:hypothetical protein
VVTEINPYASPAIPGGYDASGGIGVWRDGDRLVLHQKADLPRFCVVTGEPARFGYYFEIAWNYPGDLDHRLLGLYVPLCARIHRAYRLWRWAALLIPLVALGICAASIYNFGLDHIATYIALPGFLAAFAAGIYIYVQHSEFLYFVAVHGDYLWLKGADNRYLDRLPDWPFYGPM